MCMLSAVLMILSLAACGSTKQEAPKQEPAKQEETKQEVTKQEPAKQEETKQEGFQPSLDTSASCQITVAGGYDNFEALEAEFDRFNEYYPNVELMFTKVS